MDTASTNLTIAPVAAPGPFQSVYGGGGSDDFLAIFRPDVTGTTTSHLLYCTYLGIDAEQATVTGVAVDSVGTPTSPAMRRTPPERCSRPTVFKRRTAAILRMDS